MTDSGVPIAPFLIILERGVPRRVAIVVGHDDLPAGPLDRLGDLPVLVRVDRQRLLDDDVGTGIQARTISSAWVKSGEVMITRSASGLA